MNPAFRLTAFVFALTVSPIALAQSFAIHFSPVANFTYQLDCITKQASSCAGREDYQALWSQEFGINAENHPSLKRWVVLREKLKTVDQQESQKSAKPKLAEAPTFRVTLDRRLTLAGLSTREFDAYVSEITTILDSTSAAEAIGIAKELYPAFHRWWLTDGQASGAAQADNLITENQRPDVKQHVDDIYKFYGSPVPARQEHRAALVVRPGIKNLGTTSGEALGSDSLVEFFATKPGQVIRPIESQTPVFQPITLTPSTKP